MRRNLFLLVTAVALVCLLGGCSRIIVDRMVEAPNKGRAMNPEDDTAPWRLEMLGVDEQFRVAVGPPEASLLVWVLEPRDVAAVADDAPRGTILILHGFHTDSYWMLPFAEAFAEAGYRSVLVDLRGHGRSSGDYLTFGVQETRDLRQVIDELERRGLATDRLGVWGISYGGATAIQLAAAEPRIDAVVAVAPFATMRDVVHNYVRGLLPMSGLVFSHDEVARLVGEESLFPAIRMADKGTLICTEGFSCHHQIGHHISGLRTHHYAEVLAHSLRD